MFLVSFGEKGEPPIEIYLVDGRPCFSGASAPKRNHVFHPRNYSQCDSQSLLLIALRFNDFDYFPIPQNFKTTVCKGGIHLRCVEEEKGQFFFKFTQSIVGLFGE